MSSRSRISKETRLRILARDNQRCQYCGLSIADGVKLTVDHFLPISRGGTDLFDNLWTLCLECNEGKGDLILRRPTQKILSVGIHVPLDYSIDQVTQALQYYKSSNEQNYLTIYQAIIVVQTPGVTDSLNPLFYPLPAKAIVNALYSLEKEGKLKIENAKIDISML